MNKREKKYLVDPLNFVMETKVTRKSFCKIKT